MNRKLKALLALLLLVAMLFTGCAEVIDEILEELPEATTQQETVRLETIAPETTLPPETTAPPTETTEAATVPPSEEETEAPTEEAVLTVVESGEYTSKEEVAAYIHAFGHLPGNYITKAEAEALGWVSSKGNLGKVAPGKSIGGSRFGNYEGLLPTAKGRKYTECDIDFDGTYRNEKRIVFSNDGLIYYTGDHYETFELLYGEE